MRVLNDLFPATMDMSVQCKFLNIESVGASIGAMLDWWEPFQLMERVKLYLGVKTGRVETTV